MPPDPDSGRRLAFGTSVNATGALLGQAATVATAAVAINRIGSEAFAYIVLAQSLTLWPQLLEKGLGFSVIRLVSVGADDRDSRSHLGSALMLYLGLGVVTGVFGLLASRLLTLPALGFPAETRSSGIRAFELLVLAAAVRNSTGFLPRVLLAQGRLVALRAVELVRDLVPLAVTLWWVGNGPDAVVWVAVAMLAGDIGAAGIGLVMARVGRLGMRLRESSRRSVGEHFRSSRPLIASGLINLLSSRIDVLVVSIALGPAATSTYGLVARVLESFLGAMTLLSLAITPTAARMLARGRRSAVATVFRRASGYSALLCWPISAAIALLGVSVAQSVLDDDLPQLASAVAVAMLLPIPNAVVLAGNAVMVAADRVGELLKPIAIGTAMNVAVSIGLVGVFGVPAVFLGTLVETCVLAWWMLRSVGDVVGSPLTSLLGGLRRPALLTGLATALLGAVRMMPTGRMASVGLASGVGVCYLALALAWAVPRHELRQIVGRR